MRFRVEHDALGEKKVPAEAYYGIQTLRSKENFQITKRGLSRQMIKALATVKKAAAKANYDAGLLSKEVSDAICLSCDEILNGRLHGQFVTDAIQGGAGTSMNMNANEVIANRANEMLGGKKGEYRFVHPINHVNCGQSTNDVVPTASKIAMIRLTKKLLVEMKKLSNAYIDRASELKNTYKMGRTHLQDALPMTFGQQLLAYQANLDRDMKRIDQTMQGLLEINMGATAIGSGVNANKTYVTKVIKHIQTLTGESFYNSKNLFDTTRNLDAFLWLSSSVKTAALDLSKTAKDFILMASGPEYGFHEVILPQVQPGSSIMPGKFNPVIAESVNQVAYLILGNDVTISKVIEAGQMELNVYSPVMYTLLTDSINYLRRVVRTFREKIIEGFVAIQNPKIFEDQTFAMLAVLIPHLGYERCTEIAKIFKQTSKTLKEVVLEETDFSPEQIDEFFNLDTITKPGIQNTDLLDE